MPLILLFVFHSNFSGFLFVFHSAQRLGVLNVKMAIVQILKNFQIHVKDYVEEMEIGNFGIPIIPKHGVFVELSRKRNSSHTQS